MKSFIFALTLIGLTLLVGCTSSQPPESESHEKASDAAQCTEPENPYDEGSGHYAGYEWAEKNPGPCGGSSQSFTEGCEEHEHQESEYEECEDRKRR